MPAAKRTSSEPRHHRLRLDPVRRLRSMGCEGGHTKSSHSTRRALGASPGHSELARRYTTLRHLKSRVGGGERKGRGPANGEEGLLSTYTPLKRPHDSHRSKCEAIASLRVPTGRLAQRRACRPATRTPEQRQAASYPPPPSPSCMRLHVTNAS